MTSLVLCHLMNCVVCSIHTRSLSILGNTELILACTTLSSNTCLKIALCILQYIAQQFSKLACVLSLLKSVTLESLSNFRIALAVSLTAHCQIHTNLTTLTIEVSLKVLNHLSSCIFLACSTKSVNSSKSRTVHWVFHFLELASRSLANRALLRSLCTFMNITTYCANKFLFHNIIV